MADHGIEPGVPAAADLGRGTRQAGLRLYHERLVLSLVRRQGNMPKAAIARATGLSAQAVSVIVRRLENDGLLSKLTPQRGKVGQPLVPFTLNPDGAFFIGLKIGRRSGELILLDLAGRIRGKLRQPYPYPVPDDILAFARTGLGTITRLLSRRQRARIAGLGIAAPFELWNWEDIVGAPATILKQWQRTDLRRDIEALCDWPVHFCNDATAACAGELVFGQGARHRDHVYFYVGYFIGGGIVINGSLYQGRSGNAGALGSMPVPAPSGPAQLIRSASLHVLEDALRSGGRDPAILWQSPDQWGEIGVFVDAWIAVAAHGIAHAIAAAASLVDFQAAIIDGAFPVAVRRALTDTVRARFAAIDKKGLSPIAVEEGTIGSDARALGAASLPLLANFAIDRDVLFKDAE